MEDAAPRHQGRRRHRYLRVEDLARLRHLAFSPRRIVEGQYSGRHTSPQRGYSVEFSDYREYTPGDEVSDIDWKVFGRSDRLFVKLFEHQSEMTVSLLVDGSASMAYRGGTASRGGAKTLDAGSDRPASKYDYSCLMAAAIAFLVVQNQDRVAFGVAREGLEQFQPPLGTQPHLTSVLRAMERVHPRGRARLADALQRLAERTRQRSVVVVFSDLFDRRDDVLRSLNRFMHEGSEVLLFHVLHEHELNLPDLGEAIFTDSETRDRIRLNVEDVRSIYERRLKEFLDGWAAAVKGCEIGYSLVSTATPYNKALEKYLFRRATVR